MSIDHILDHVQQALAKALTQYKEKPKAENFITAFSEQIQGIEDALFGMVITREVATAVGVQLNNIGTIVGEDRGDLDDDHYRILIYVKIGQNTSQGNMAKIINVFKLLTQADSVFCFSLNNAEIQLNSSAPIADKDINFIFRNMKAVIAGGVRIDHIVCYDPVAAFAFAGTNPVVTSLGFSDISGTTGGHLASLKKEKIPFSFSGNNKSTKGFGSLIDPLAGGVLVGIKGV